LIPVFIFCVALLLGCSDRTRNPTNTSDLIYGYIWDKNTKNSIHGAEVTISHQVLKNEIHTDSTDSEGVYSFENPVLGAWEIAVKVKGYKKAVGGIVYDGGELYRNFELTPDTTQIAGF
jgi:hypothetical protein